MLIYISERFYKLCVLQVYGKDKKARALPIKKEKGSGNILFTEHPSTEVFISKPI